MRRLNMLRGKGKRNKYSLYRRDQANPSGREIVLPDRAIEFTIELLSRVEPLSRPPYRIAPTKLAELKE
jgi:hypothetical protein